MELKDYNYDEIEITKTFEFKRILTQEDMENFSKLTGDFNPLHCDENYAKNTFFKKNIVHGMLAGSLFSTLVGMICPGKKNLYLSQTLNFKKPIYPNSELTVKGTIQQKIDSLKILVVKTEIIVNEEIVIDGQANVKLI